MALWFLAAPSPGAAEPRFGLPIDCEPGIDCWIPRYVDIDPGPGAMDYACGRLTDSGHDGTDIAIRDLGAMAEGVRVLAAAGGTVAAVRDGMPDVDVRVVGTDSVRGRECGNGVLLDHGDGWQTLYCHLRRGSMVVAPGANVEAGDTLGLVGMSGLSSFPHVHLTVRKDDRALDPFLGLEQGRALAEGAARCGLGERPLWRADVLEALPYRPVMITDAGFATEAPDAAAVRSGQLRTSVLSPDAPALVFWMAAYGLEAGDLVQLRLIAPDGRIVAEDRREQARTQPWSYAFAGRARNGPGWTPGMWRGEVEIRRGDERFRLERRLEIR